MRIRHQAGAVLAIALLMSDSASLFAQPDLNPPASKKEDKDIIVLGKGPVHEAFAQPSNETKPGPGTLVPKQPPAPVPEVPPEEKPNGANVVWIPGYWAWDIDRADFIWVSGIWRNVPPGEKWTPGYWAPLADSNVWVSGYWTRAAQPDYLRPPPASLDYGPNTPSPGNDYFWVPGTWLWQDDRYLWRPGYWSRARPGWLYTPPRYSWTPAGNVFSDGFWDYDLPNRGWLYAPVCFNSPLWANPGWGFQPWCLLDCNGLLGSLFYGPCNHFWFGNFYGPRYGGLGFSPWAVAGARNFDPLFAQSRIANRDNPNWASGLRNEAAARGAGRAAVPAGTLAEQRALAKNGAGSNAGLLRSASQMDPRGVSRLTASQQEAHRQEGQRGQEARQARDAHEKAVSAGKAPAISSSSGSAGRGNELIRAPQQIGNSRTIGSAQSGNHPTASNSVQRGVPSQSNFGQQSNMSRSPPTASNSAAVTRSPTVSRASSVPASSHSTASQAHVNHAVARPASRPSLPSPRSTPSRSTGGHTSSGHSSGGGHHR